MLTKQPLAEWFATYQYSVKLCCSQDEEMSIIGALFYGSLFLYCDGLLKSILSHPDWITLNKNKEKPIIIDLIVKPFKCPGKSINMIFVQSERSKKEEATKFFLSLYDGTPKRYPRGDMLFFIPVTSKLEDDYTDAQRVKFIFNHTAYLGEEDCTAIFGFTDINTQILLKDGKQVALRTLLKSLPASTGMSRPRLFQVVDPNGGQNCTLVTFQRCDRPAIEERKATLEDELCSHLAPGEIGKALKDETDSLRFVGAFHKNKGEVIRIHNPSKTHLDFMEHADRLLSSPPKKRSNSTMVTPDQSVTTSSTSTPTVSVQTGNINYSQAVQAYTTQIRSVNIQPRGGMTMTTMTQTSQLVSAVMESRFQTIEQEQQDIKHRLHSVEHRTTTTDENIRLMMAH
jgi:hypothetical protein